MSISPRLQLAVEGAEISGRQRADIGVDRYRGGALILAPFRHQIGRAGHEHVRHPLAYHRPHAALMLGIEKRPEEADGDRLDALGDEPLDRSTGLRLVQGHHHLAEAIDSLGDTRDQPFRHDRVGLLALGEMHDLAHVAPTDAARSPHDVDDVAMPLGGDEAELGAALLHDGIGADRGPVRKYGDVAVELLRSDAQLRRRRADRIDHALGEIARRRGRLRRGDGAAVVDHHAIRESAADIDANKIRGHARSASQKTRLYHPVLPDLIKRLADIETVSSKTIITEAQRAPRVPSLSSGEERCDPHSRPLRRCAPPSDDYSSQYPPCLW